MTDTPMKAAELLPCPFCGSRSTELQRGGDGWLVERCLDCGALGPCVDLEGEGALAKWNRRAPSQAAGPSEQSEQLQVDPARCDRVAASVRTLDAASESERRWRYIAQRAIASLRSYDDALASHIENASKAARQDEPKAPGERQAVQPVPGEPQ